MNQFYPYSKAIFELLENNITALNSISEQLNELNQIAQKEDFIKKFLQAPSATKEEKINFIQKLFPDLFQNNIMNKLIHLLADKKKLYYLLDIGPSLEELIHLANERTSIEIISSIPLQEAELEKIKSSLEKSLKKEIVLKTLLDENLIAGLIIKTDDYILDNSLRGRLQKMKQSLLKTH